MRTIIIGGVAGGMSAATRLRRLQEDAEIVVYERGEHVSFANCGLPYYVGEVISERDALLLQTPASLAARFHLDVRVRHDVVSIDPVARTLHVTDLTTGHTATDHYDNLVLSTGASPIVPDFPGSDRCLTLRDVHDTDVMKTAVDALVKTGGRAVVIGGGFIGVEVAENLRHRGVAVTLVELAQQVLPPLDPEMAAYVADELLRHDVDLRLGTSVTEVTPTTVALATGEVIDAELVIAAIGVRPETELARTAGCAVGPRGGIVVDDHLRTTVEGIYAVGDAVEKTDPLTDDATLIPLANLANRQGRVAADVIAGRSPAPGSHLARGTGIVRVFGLTVATTGANARSLTRAGVPYRTIATHPASHAGYYPGAHTMHLTLLYCPSDGAILGAQGVGGDGVDRRIDVIATAQRGGLTAPDLLTLELAYAPPYGSAKDPVNQLGYIAENALLGGEELVTWDDPVVEDSETLVIDVRTPSEYARGTVPRARNIPVDELRGRLSELGAPGERQVVVTCQVGQRGHVAARLLMGHGYRVANLTGGYATWSSGQRSRELAAGSTLA